MDTAEDTSIFLHSKFNPEKQKESNKIVVKKIQ